MMNDSRNGTEYQCVIIDTMTQQAGEDRSDIVFLLQLHVAGEY